MRQAAIRWAFWAFGAVGLYYLVTEHRVHLLDYLPFILLMACPLMHFLHGHGQHEPDHHGEREDRPHAS